MAHRFDRSDLPAHFSAIPDWKGYLARMAAPLLLKMYIAHFIPAFAKFVLDVGCADGTITLALAQMFPKIHFHGIDLNAKFIEIARARAKELGLTNVTLECIYLRQVLDREQRYDAVIFCSVLHEFFSYGEGMSSVLKALADAHELLNKNGVVIIRDMILKRFTAQSRLRVKDMREKIEARATPEILADFVCRWGKLTSVARVNHFLLKYMYEQNWVQENLENYVEGVFIDDYEQILHFLDMEVQQVESMLIDFLKDKWVEDFGLTQDELAQLTSTTLIVARKKAAPRRHTRPKPQSQ